MAARCAEFGHTQNERRRNAFQLVNWSGTLFDRSGMVEQQVSHVLLIFTWVSSYCRKIHVGKWIGYVKLLQGVNVSERCRWWTGDPSGVNPPALCPVLHHDPDQDKASIDNEKITLLDCKHWINAVLHVLFHGRSLYRLGLAYCFPSLQ